MATDLPVPSRNDVYHRYLPVVRRIAIRTARTLPSSITVDDVISAGWLGMVEALERRVPSMDEEQFEAYASHRVRGAILDYLRKLDPLSRRLRSASRLVAQSISTLVARLGRTPDEEEIAVEMGLSLEEYQELLGQIGEVGFARLETFERSDIAPSPEAVSAKRELVERVAESIEDLPERLKLVLGLYYQEDCTFREIGEILGVSESRVCQLHSEAIHRLRVGAERPGRPRPKT